MALNFDIWKFIAKVQPDRPNGFARAAGGSEAGGSEAGGSEAGGSEDYRVWMRAPGTNGRGLMISSSRRR
jgi:hypothetical protein